MRKLLLAVLAFMAFAVPAFATDFQGGALHVIGSRPINDAGIMPTNTQVLTADYSNVTNFTGQVFLNGGATLQGANTITRLVADDCTFNGVHAGQDVNQFIFSVANLNGATVTFRPRIRFWFADGASGAPGTYYNQPVAVGFSFNPITQIAGSAFTYSAALPAGQFTMPAGTMWAGITFDDNNGTTGITATQLNNLGQGIFDPPTTGTSADLLFVTQAAGSFFGIANPPGGLGNFGGAPMANFGWEFSTDVVTGVKTTTWGSLKKLYR